MHTSFPRLPTCVLGSRHPSADTVGGIYLVRMACASTVSSTANTCNQPKPALHGHNCLTSFIGPLLVLRVMKPRSAFGDVCTFLAMVHSPASMLDEEEKDWYEASPKNIHLETFPDGGDHPRILVCVQRSSQHCAYASSFCNQGIGYGAIQTLD